MIKFMYKLMELLLCKTYISKCIYLELETHLFPECINKSRNGDAM